MTLTEQQIAARVARQSGRPQTQRRVVIGPHGWTLATLPIAYREADNGR